MASKEAFEDHCWKDVMSAADMKLYSPYARETFIGPSARVPGDRSLQPRLSRRSGGMPVDLDPQYPNSCGIYAHRAIELDQAAVRRRPACRPAGVLLHPGSSATEPTERRNLNATEGEARQPQRTTGFITSSNRSRRDVIIYKQRAAFSKEHRSCRTSICLASAACWSAARARQGACAPARWMPIQTDFTSRSSRNVRSTGRSWSIRSISSTCTTSMST